MSEVFGFVIDMAQIFAIAGLSLWVWSLQKRVDKIHPPVVKELIEAETQRKKAHTEVFKRLTDPEALDSDLEKGARLREMLDAGRTTLPRDGARNAVVHRPPLRNQPPASFRPVSPRIMDAKLDKPQNTD